MKQGFNAIIEGPPNTITKEGRSFLRTVMLFKIGEKQNTDFLDLFVEKCEAPKRTTAQSTHKTSFRNLGDKWGVSTTVVLAVKLSFEDEQILGIGCMVLDKNS